MNILKEINPAGLDEEEVSGFRVRRAVRAVLTDDDDLIALLDVKKQNYHKLPGGGVEKDEDNVMALKRECLEETGCIIEVGEEVGSVVEYREKFKLKQISDCYLARVVGKKREPAFTDSELKNRFELMWVTIDEAIKLLEADEPMDYEGSFIRERDLTFLIEAHRHAA